MPVSHILPYKKPLYYGRFLKLPVFSRIKLPFSTVRNTKSMFSTVWTVNFYGRKFWIPDFYRTEASISTGKNASAALFYRRGQSIRDPHPLLQTESMLKRGGWICCHHTLARPVLYALLLVFSCIYSYFDNFRNIRIHIRGYRCICVSCMSVRWKYYS